MSMGYWLHSNKYLFRQDTAFRKLSQELSATSWYDRIFGGYSWHFDWDADPSLRRWIDEHVGKGSVQEKRNYFFLARDIPKFMD